VIQPQEFHWDGSAMVPHNRRLAERQYSAGEIYRLGVIEERSTASHNHEFAALHEAWLNLPEELAVQYPTETHLRKAALIATGWRDTQTYACGTRAEALRWAERLKPLDEFSLVYVTGTTVTRCIAKSQSQRAMGKSDWEKSKADVLEYVASLIGTSPSQLKRAGAVG